MTYDLAELIAIARLRIMRRERRRAAWLSILAIMERIPGGGWNAQ